MIKLSELKDDEILLVNNIIITKTELLNELEYYKDNNEKLEVYTTKVFHEVKFNAKDILENAIYNESEFMYESWSDSVNRDITEDDLKDIQIVLDRILERNKEFNVSYEVDEEVEIDIEEGKIN